MEQVLDSTDLQRDSTIKAHAVWPNLIDTPCHSPCPCGRHWSTRKDYPFIILIADSARRASLNIAAIKYEMETNVGIKQDYDEIRGNVIEDFTPKDDSEEWQKQNIVLWNGVRILARSRGHEGARTSSSPTPAQACGGGDPEDGE